MPHLYAILAILAPSHRTSNGLLRWLYHLGGVGLILLGLLDNSVVPVPGSVDAFTIVLAAGQRDWWPYYALMATIGAVIGGSLTYRIARREGKTQLETRFRGQMERVERIFSKWGFGAIVLFALLPPPAPMVPFLIAAGAAQYSRKKFIAALAIGRGIRYSVLAFLAAIYGRAILHVFLQHGRLVLIVLCALIAAAVAGFFVFHYLSHRRGNHKSAQHA